MQFLKPIVLGLAVAGLVPLGEGGSKDAGESSALPKCIEVHAEARYGAMGYDHWVSVANHCDSSAECQVSTNVNPQPQSVRVKPGETREVLTFRGSPARTFEPRVACTLTKPDSPKR